MALTKKGGYILFIVPNNWMSFADRNVLPKELSKFQFRVLDINGAKKYFPKIGSSFTWFLLQKVPNTQSFEIRNHYVFDDIQKASLNKDSDFIPLYYSELTQSIVNKILNANLPRYKIQTSSNLHRYAKKPLYKILKTIFLDTSSFIPQVKAFMLNFP